MLKVIKKNGSFQIKNTEIGQYVTYRNSTFRNKSFGETTKIKDFLEEKNSKEIVDMGLSYVWFKKF